MQPTYTTNPYNLPVQLTHTLTFEMLRIIPKHMHITPHWITLQPNALLCKVMPCNVMQDNELVNTFLWLKIFITIAECYI